MKKILKSLLVCMVMIATVLLNNSYVKAEDTIEVYDGVKYRVNNEQREVMYKERRRVLDGDDMKESVLNMMNRSGLLYVDIQGMQQTLRFRSWLEEELLFHR